MKKLILKMKKLRLGNLPDFFQKSVLENDRSGIQNQVYFYKPCSFYYTNKRGLPHCGTVKK